ncbi:hypothetical protein ACI1VK_14690, partial [Escherichia coli]
MLKIIPGATGYFNKTLNSNQFDNEDAIKDKLDNRGSIKGKLNNIYGKSICLLYTYYHPDDTPCLIHSRRRILTINK